MKKMTRRILAWMLAGCMTLGLTSCSSNQSDPGGTSNGQQGSSSSQQQTTSSQEGSTTISYTDAAGRQLEVDTASGGIASLFGPSFEKCLLLGAADRVVASMSLSPWAAVVCPHAEDITTIANPTSPNVEELMASGVEEVLFWSNFEDVINSMSDAGLDVICFKTVDGKAISVDEFADCMTEIVYDYAEVLGEEAMARADAYTEYFNEKLEYVSSRIATLSEDDIVTCYWIRSSEDGLEAFVSGSAPEVMVRLAGGYLVTCDYAGNGANANTYGTVSMEEIVNWDPEVVFMGRTTDTSKILNNDQWASISAVKNGAVYEIPNGVFYWDNSSELILCLEYVAQILHPELFEDLDMVAEIQEFYSLFYDYDLTEEQATQILNHQDPTV